MQVASKLKFSSISFPRMTDKNHCARGKTLKSKTEQIQVILTGNTFRWAVNQLQPPEIIDEKRYSDFISVTPDEIEAYVKEHGFPEHSVEVIYKGQGVFAEDKLCIVETPPGWEVFYIERGQRSDESSYLSLEEACREVIQRRIKTAKIELNHRFHNAHPELNLPRPSEMD
jgi:hypothetical protein